jgi:hypothetical protein
MPLSLAIATRLQYQLETISALIAGVPEERLRQRNSSGKWSVFENMAHLAAYQPVFIARVRRIEKGEDPVFDRYAAEEDPLFPGYVDKGLEELIRVLARDRAVLIGIAGGLDEASFRRTGLHPKFGLLNMEQWMDFFLLHEAHHLFTMFRLIPELKAANN